MASKDVKVVEKEQLIIEGVFIGDDFVDRKTGKSIATKLTPQGLLDLIKAENGIVADLSEDGTKVELHLEDIKVKGTNIIIEPDTQATVISFTDELVDPHRHIHLLWEVESNGLHYGGDVVLHPVDAESQCVSAGRFLAENDFHDFSATVDNDGLIALTLIGVQVATTDVVKIHYTLLS